jgi:hypothetical protein
MAWVAAVLAVAFLSVLSVGYIKAGVPVPLTSGYVWITSHSYRVTRVDPAAIRSGLQPGGVLDFRRLSAPQRFRTNYASDDASAGDTIALPFLRNGAIVNVAAEFAPASTRHRIDDAIDIVERLFLCAFGVLLLARGRDRVSLCGAIFMVSLGLSGGLLSFRPALAGLPDGIDIAAAVVMGISTVVVISAAFLFAESFLARDTPTPLRWVFRSVAMLAGAEILLGQVQWLLYLATGDVLLPIALSFELNAGAWMTWIALMVAMLGVATSQRHEPNRAAIRIVFWSTLVGLSGPLVNTAFALFNAEVPFHYALGLSVVVMAAGIAYAALARQLLDVDFFVNRALVYGIVLAIVAALLSASENLIEHAALGNDENRVLSLLAPIVIGFSIRWIEGRVEAVIERTFYRDKMAAHAQLKALGEDFAEAHDREALTQRVADEIRRQLRVTSVIVYGERDGSEYEPLAHSGAVKNPASIEFDDSVFLRLRSQRHVLHTKVFVTALPFAGVIFPMVVLGQLFGAILVGHRAHDEGLDPDDEEVLHHLAHELGIALLWSELAHPGAVPAS